MAKAKHSRSGFTLVEIMIVVAIIGLLASIAIPNFVRSRTRAQTNVCINNLRVLESAKTQWALEFKKVDTDTVRDTDLSPYLRASQWPSCPANGTYEVTTVSASPTCSVDGHSL